MIEVHKLPSYEYNLPKSLGTHEFQFHSQDRLGTGTKPILVPPQPSQNPGPPDPIRLLTKNGFGSLPETGS